MKKETEEFGRKLKNLREEQGLTQIEVAKRLGYSSAQFVSNWERGLSFPPIKALGDVAELYKADTDEIFEGILNYQVASLKNSMTKEFKQHQRRWK